MGNQFGYKKYMKKEAQKDHSLVKIFLISFWNAFSIYFCVKSFSPSVDTSIGDYQQEAEVDTQEEPKKIVDDRLSMIQSEDQGRSFSELMAKPDDTAEVKETVQVNTATPEPVQTVNETTVTPPTPQAEPVYKVFVGTYTSAEQAKVAKDIIQESGNGLNPIVKCIGSNNYTLR